MCAGFWFGMVCLILPLLIPVFAVALRFCRPISIDRVLVGKSFPLYVVGYVVLSVFLIYLPVFLDLPRWNEQVQYPDNFIWNHLFSPGSSDKDNILYYRFIDVLGIFIFNVLLITTLVNSLARLREKWKAGRIYYNRALYGVFKQNNVIAVLGNHDAIFGIVKQCLSIEEKPKYVLVLIDGDIDEYRSRMLSTISMEDIKKVVLCRGSLASGLDLANIHIEKASEVFVVGNKIDPSGRISLHDAECIKCIRLLRDGSDGNDAIITSARLEHRPTLICRVFFEYQTSYSVFQTADIGDRPESAGTGKCMRAIVFKPVNFYEQSCEKVIAAPLDRNTERSEYIPIDGERGISAASDEFVHLIVVGQTKMGTALAVETAHLAHFPNFHRMEKGKRVGPRTRISFIDKDADIEKDYFMGRFKELFEVSPWKYRDLSSSYYDTEWVNPMADDSSEFRDGHIGEDFIDVEWEFIKGNIASSTIKQYLLDSVREANAKCTIAICFHNQNDSVAAAQYLSDEVCRKSQEILVYQSREGSVIDEMLCFDTTGKFKNFRSFGTISKFYDVELSNSIENQFDEGLKYFDPRQSVGKSQIACWWSNRYRELSTWIKMRSFGTDYEKVDLESFSSVEHSRWNMEQLLLGFRPLTKEEQDSCHSAKGDVIKSAKDKLKSRKAHLDICSREKLKHVDEVVTQYDSPMEHGILKLEYIRNYNPRPVNTDEIRIPDAVAELAESLSEDSMKNIKVLLASAYSIELSEGVRQGVTPVPLDKISDQLAKDAHDVRALSQINAGWHYGPEEDEINKIDPYLMPYGFLPESAKERLKERVRLSIEEINSVGCCIVKGSE